MLPPNTPFSETERRGQISHRMAGFHTQLEYVNSFYQYSVEYLDLSRIRKLVGLLKYINWTNFSETAGDYTTKTIADLVARIRGGTDQMSAGIVADAVSQTERRVRSAISALSELAEYHKQNYKRELRIQVLHQLTLTDPAGAGRESSREQIRRAFASTMASVSYFPELVDEVIDEDFAANGPELQQASLDKLKVRVRRQKRQKQDDPKQLLLDAIRMLIGCGHSMEIATRAVVEAGRLTSSKRRGLGQRIRAWFEKAVVRRTPVKRYEIDFTDPSAGSRHREVVVFEPFIQATSQKIKLFTALTNPKGTNFQKLRQAGEEKVFEFLNKNLSEVDVIHRRLSGLNELFSASLAKAGKSAPRGIKLEMDAVKNALIRANKKKHEYMARKEEKSQARKLGLDGATAAAPAQPSPG